MSANVVGIDIGTAGVRAVEVAAGKNKASVVRFHQVPLPEGAVNRGEVVEPNTVASALKQLWSTGGFKSKNVVLGMGNHRVLSRDLTVPRASLAHIRESLPFQVQDMLPIPLDEALLDFYPVAESEGESGPVVTGLLIAAVKDAVKGNVRAVELAGLLPLDVDLIPFALTRVLNMGDSIPGTVAQVDVGAATTSIVITTDGVPQFVRLIPAGGTDVTHALVETLGLTPEEADRLKRTLGMRLPAADPDASVDNDIAENSTDAPAIDERAAVSLIRDISGELLSSVRNTANYFTNTRQTSVTRIVLTGGGSRLPGFAEGLAELTRLTVASAEISRMVSYGRSVKADELRGSQGAFLVALGLALGSAA
jgi:type IV pilus assembly protein PilM